MTGGTSQFVSVADGYYCHDCGDATTNKTMHRLLRHTAPFKRW